MHRKLSRLVSVAAACVLGAAAQAQIPIDSNTFGGMSARAIGPAVMSGRIAALDAVATDPLTVYVGSASGGVWKSKDAGVTFEPIFDDHTMSIGAVTVDPSNPETIWVGTGETWVRNSVSVGDGVYKSTDGGETWTHLGLEDSERIATIRVHPTDGDVVWVCATGHLWSPGGERGVYKTSDGGETWKNVLAVDEDTGCADLDVDPQEPDLVYAAMWQFRRAPDFFTSGGPGSGLHRSNDGGETWTRLEEGLPEGELGRIAVAVAPSRPSVVYATVEAEKTALYRSDDLGESWTELDGSLNVSARPFYFSELVVDPTDHDRVYKPGLFLTVSTDGGKSMSSPFTGGGPGGGVHSDHHALWIHPDNPHQLLLGTDGGLYVSENRGNTWRHVGTLPVSQFYRVAHDHQWPYNVFGGLQDNGTWIGPSRSPGGIQNRDWENIGFGDGFWAFVDPQNPDVFFTEYQGGQLLRVDRRFKSVKSIKPYAGDEQEKLRFNWNTPMHLSPNDDNTLYYGSQYLHRSRDRGESWQTISPDLTTDDPARQRQARSGGLSIDNTTAENNATIYSISESPRNGDVIWVGTDDGRVQLTRDGGASWTDVAGNVPGVPPGTWVSTVHASSHDDATAFVTFDGHRNGDMATYVYVTDDFGATWRSISSDEIEGYAWVVRQDPVNADLLYLGTEHGLWITLDGGRNWARFSENLPRVAVHDVVVHPTEHDLILGTHGRGIYVIDDVTPLRHLEAEALEADVTLLPTRPAVQMIASSLQEFAGDAEFVGPNPPEAATIAYYLKRRHLFGDLKIEIYDGDGERVATLPGKKRKGLNRVEWPMYLKPPKMPRSTALVPAFIGPRVPEGTYRLRLIKGEETIEGEIELVADPRNPHSAADRELQQETAMKLYHRLADLTFLAARVDDLRLQTRERIEKLGARDRLRDRLEAFDRSLEELAGDLAVQEGGMMAGGEELRERLGTLYGDVSRYEGRPTESQLQRMASLEGELAAAKARLEKITASLPELSRQLERKGLEPITPLDRESWEEKEGVGASMAVAKKELPRLRELLTLAGYGW